MNRKQTIRYLILNKFVKLFPLRHTFVSLRSFETRRTLREKYISLRLRGELKPKPHHLQLHVNEIAFIRYDRKINTHNLTIRSESGCLKRSRFSGESLDA